MWTASSVFAKSTLRHIASHSGNQALPPLPFSGKPDETSLSHRTCSSTFRTVKLFLTFSSRKQSVVPIGKNP